MKTEKNKLGRKLVAAGTLVILASALLYFYFYPHSPVPRAAGEVLQQASDATTTGKVASAFALSKRLSAYDIGVTTQAAVVTLTGRVPSEIDKELAENVAQDTTGVKQVLNQLQVEPTVKPSEVSLRESGRIADLEIQADLRERLATSPELAGKPIQVSVQNRTVTLTGQVETPAQKTGAEQLARSLANVAAVTNQLSVSNPATAQAEVPGISAKDTEISRQIGFALFTERENFQDVGAIKVECKQGRVTLSGTVGSRAERALALRIAREVKDVATINNQLQVATGI
ncbi:MAG: BON domain-containing protein [Acidobacteria bacterium]|nr:BON domain-containing protein [Acidobacteriota bacterium]MBI3422358.1 BON domain-containing protein [Acidobacteriota bacterium]